MAAERPRPASHFFTYPVVASVYSVVRAGINKQALIPIRIDCLGENASCDPFPGANYGFYVGAYFLLFLLIPLPMLILSCWPDRYAPEGTFLGSARGLFRDLSLLWSAILAWGGGVLSVEIHARGLIPHSVNLLGIAAAVYTIGFGLPWLWSVLLKKVGKAGVR